MNKIVFKGRKQLPNHTRRDYGSYGSYVKIDGKWKRLRKGQPSFRKTINHKLMSLFLKEKGLEDCFLQKSNVRTLRSIIKSKNLSKEYMLWNIRREDDGKEI